MFRSTCSSLVLSFSYSLMILSILHQVNHHQGLPPHLLSRQFQRVQLMSQLLAAHCHPFLQVLLQESHQQPQRQPQQHDQSRNAQQLSEQVSSSQGEADQCCKAISALAISSHSRDESVISMAIKWSMTQTHEQLCHLRDDARYFIDSMKIHSSRDSWSLLQFTSEIRSRWWPVLSVSEWTSLKTHGWIRNSRVSCSTSDSRFHQWWNA